MHGEGKLSNPTPEVDGYLSQLDSQRRPALAEVRSVILEIVPSAVESMRYRMPTYDYEGAMLCAFASQKQYMSLYVEPRILDGYRTALQHLNRGKSCIRFKSIDQLPLNLVRTVLEETVQDLDAGRAEQDKK